MVVVRESHGDGDGVDQFMAGLHGEDSIPSSSLSWAFCVSVVSVLFEFNVSDSSYIQIFVILATCAETERIPNYLVLLGQLTLRPICLGLIYFFLEKVLFLLLLFILFFSVWHGVY